MVDAHWRRAARLNLFLCFLAAVLEGYDIQSAGVAAGAMATRYGLDPAQLGFVFSINVLGLFFGAAIGGRLSDRFGRRAVLAGSVAILGGFTLATPFAGDYAGLLVFRLLTGLGLGGALPNLIALAAESVRPERRASGVVLMFSGLPIGAIGAAGVGVWVAAGGDWRAIFLVGGVLPLLLAPVLALWLRDLAGGAVTSEAPVAMGFSLALFGEGRAVATLLLWVSFFFTLLVLYLMLNWLPALLEARGVARADTMWIAMIFNLGGIAGALTLGWLLDRWPRRVVLVILFAGMAAGLTALSLSGASFAMIAGAGLLAGFFVVSAQFVLYGLAPALYPASVRGTGVGAAVAVGRFGSVLGPLAAGQLLAMGGSAHTVLLAALPVIAIAAAAALLLPARPPDAVG